MTKLDPAAPTRRWAAAMKSRTSAVVIPSRSIRAVACCTCRVMDLACCIRAISAADLTIRQPWITGPASTSSSPVSLPSRVTASKLIAGSTASRPPPRSRIARPTRA